MVKERRVDKRNKPKSHLENYVATRSYVPDLANHSQLTDDIENDISKLNILDD